MRYRAFVPYSILGTGLWASAHILIGYFFSRSIDTAAKYAGKGAFLLGDADRRSWSASVALYRHFRVAENRARRGALDGGPRRDPLARRPRPPLPAAAALPLGPGHPRRHLRPRVHLADGGPRRLPLRPRRLHRRDRRANPGPTPGDVTAMEVAEHLRGRLAHRLHQGRHASSARGVFTWGADGRLRAPSSSPAAAGPSSASCWRGWRSSRSASTRSRTRSTGRARPDRLHRLLGLLVPERPRRPLGPLRLAGGDDRAAPAPGDGARRRRSSPPGSR